MARCVLISVFRRQEEVSDSFYILPVANLYTMHMLLTMCLRFLLCQVD